MEYDNRGILFRNFRKRLPKHPDLVGEATIGGRKFKIAGWNKQGKKGEFHSLAFSQDQPETQKEEPSPSAPAPDVLRRADDDIPF